MEVIYTAAKDRQNLQKHGISLKQAEEFDVDTALFAVDDSRDYGETRYNAIGWIDARLYALTSDRTKSASGSSVSAKLRK